MFRIPLLSIALALALPFAASATEIGGTDVTLNNAVYHGCTVIREEVVGEVGRLNVYCPVMAGWVYVSPPEPTKTGWHVYVTDGLNVNEGHNCIVDHLRTLGGVDSYTFLCSS